MELKFKLNESMTSIAEKELMSPVEYCVPVDLGIGEERLKDTYLVIGSEKLALINKDGVIESYRLDELTDYAATPLVGNVILEAKYEGRSLLLCRASMGHAPRYAYIAQILEAKSEHRPERIYNDEPERRCSKCGRVLPKGSRTCPNCISKFTIFNLNIIICNDLTQDVTRVRHEYFNHLQ